MEEPKGEESNGEEDGSELRFRTKIPDLKLLPVHYEKPEHEPGRHNSNQSTQLLYTSSIGFLFLFVLKHKLGLLRAMLFSTKKFDGSKALRILP